MNAAHGFATVKKSSRFGFAMAKNRRLSEQSAGPINQWNVSGTHQQRISLFDSFGIRSRLHVVEAKGTDTNFAHSRARKVPPIGIAINLLHLKMSIVSQEIELIHDLVMKVSRI
jgi:hypothetical protein